MPVFERTIDVPLSAAELFRFHAAPRAFQRLTPPWQNVVVEQPLRALADGERAIFHVPVGPISVRWVARHERVRDGADGGEAGFDDVMERGPASSWRHEHRFTPVSADSCRLTDRITYETAPGGGLIVGPQLERMFRFRHAVTRLDAQRARTFGAKGHGGQQPRLRIGVTGATGLIGAELCALLSVLGHEPVPFVRPGRPPHTAEAYVTWTPETGTVSAAASGLDAVVHLAGENIADGRLNEDKQRRLRIQRVEQTALLWRALAALPLPPKVIIGACAVGFYGDRGDSFLTEASPRGDGPLSRFCADWEEAILAVSSSSLWRAVSLRVGIVLSPRGGALQRVLPIFRAGLGGPLGDGRAYMPWIAVDDMADVIVRAVVDDRVRGPVNGTAPTPVTNADYTRALARALHRPAVVPVPRFGLNAVLGGDLAAHIMESMRATPAALVDVGHTFRHDDIDDALAHLVL